MSISSGGIPIVLRMFQRELRSRESNAALTSMKVAYSGWRFSFRCSDGSLSAMTVKYGLARCKAALAVTFACFAKIVLCGRNPWPEQTEVIYLGIWCCLLL